MRIRELFSARDMTEGAPWKRIAEFAIPMILGNLAQQLYNTVDSIVVGQYVGDHALAAVGTSMPILNLLLALFVGVATGAGIVISQHFGAGDREALSRAIGNCITLAAIASLATMIVGSLVTWPLLRLLGTPDSVIQWCADYLMIFFLGSAGFTFYNILSGILRGMGDSFSALGFLLIATVLNIGLDIWFVAGFGMGVAGAAWATIIAQALAAALALGVLLYRLSKMESDEDAHIFDIKILKSIFKIALPSIIQQSVVSVGMLFVQVVVNRFGSSVVAGYTAATKIDSIAIVPMLGVGNAMSTFTAQNIGAKQPERIKAGYRAALCMVGVMGVAIAVAMIGFGKQLVGMFMDSESSAAAIAAGAEYISVTACFYLVFGFMNVTNGILRGSGAIMAFVLSSIGSLGIRVAVAFGFANMLSEMAVWISAPIGWVAAFIFAFAYYKTGKWKEKSLI